MRVLLFIFTLSHAFAYCQDFKMTNWTYIVETQDMSGTTDIIDFEMDQYTIDVSGDTCSYLTEDWDDTLGVVKNKSNKIWFYPNSNYSRQYFNTSVHDSLLIYDFNLGLEDSIVFPEVLGYGGYDSTYLIVSLIDSVTFTDGILRKRWHFTPSFQANSNPNSCYEYYQTVIEGVGALDPSPFGFMNSCFEVGITAYTHNGGSCMYCYQVDTKEIETDTFKTYPNPTTDNLTIEHSEHGLKTMSIIDIQGRVHFIKQYSSLTNSFSIDHLPAGMYLVKIQFQNHIQTKIIIKE